MIGKTAVVAITKHGIVIARKIKDSLAEAEIYAPIKHSDSGPDINWFDKQTTQVVANLFKTYDALICIFSLGAVIRIIAPFLVDKKTDPAVLVIDDKANFVISTLSGHLGGANALTRLIASYLNSKPVITTAADVNETIPVDLVGKNFGWIIENYHNVTKVSAFMVNEEKIGLYQEAGEKNWWMDATSFPQNVTITKELDELKRADFKGALIISDKIIADPVILEKSVIYRPKSLVVGIGLHRDTSKEVIENGIQTVLKDKGLSFKSIRNISSINKEGKIKGLQEFSEQYKIPVEIYDKGKLGQVSVPNPSKTVQKFEGIPSVSEASSILSSNNGELIVSKQKFPPNLTVAVSRVKFD
jgi:cobalt-precorrin 5A hydrolase